MHEPPAEQAPADLGDIARFTPAQIEARLATEETP